MDLNNSFIEMIKSVNVRRDQINAMKSEVLNGGNRKRAALVDDYQTHIEATFDSPDESPKRQCMQSSNQDLSSKEDDKENIENTKLHTDENISFVPLHANVKGLAALKRNGTDNKVSGACENKSVVGFSSDFQMTKCKTYIFSTNSNDLCTGPKSKLANLPNDIKQREDDIQKGILLSDDITTSDRTSGSTLDNHSSSETDNKSDGKTSQVKEIPHMLWANKPNVQNSSGSSKGKKLDSWNRAILATLDDDQGSFELAFNLPNEHDGKQNFNYDGKSDVKEGNDKDNEEELDNKNQYKDNGLKFNESRSPDDGTKYENGKASGVSNKSVDFFAKSTEDKSVLMNKKPVELDPAELPLSARKALFEKALLCGAPKVQDSIYHKMSVAQRAAMFENRSKAFSKVASPACTGSSLPNKNVIGQACFVHPKLLKTKNSCQKKGIVMNANIEKETEVSSLVTHWEKLSSAKNNYDERHIQEDDLYQHGEILSEEPKYCADTHTDEQNEVCSSEDEEISDAEESGFDTRGIMQQATFSAFEEQNQQESKASSSNVEKSVEEENKEQSKEKPSFSDNVKNEFILSELDSSNSSGSSSVSKTYSCVSSSSIDSPGSPTLSSKNGDTSLKLKADVSSDVPLLHTVSFYRKQKQEMRTPPIRTIVRREEILSLPSSNTDTEHAKAIQERIKTLQEEVLRHQTIISQSSQALNLCNATTEFCDSAEQVEGERLLLIATQKRQACLNEMQRLKAHGAQGKNISDGTGTLIIADIQLPLKRSFLASQLESSNDMVHYFLCLIRHGAQVIVTQMMSTVDKLTDGALCFTNHIKLQELPADFSVVFEVYALQTKKEILPHEKKYHIKREHSKIRLTPKGKRNDGKILLPAISSPGGPNAVRSPSFGVIGYTRFNLQNCNKKAFPLDKVLFTSPLDGVLKVKLLLHAEHKVTGKGFLTMFEDVSGFGAWHRRWCSLDGHLLVYWKYPDDEQRKEPIGAIDLKQCITGQVRLVASDICARSHTFQLVVVRPQKEGDQNTLISRCINTLTTTRHLLSADTKEERISWCNKFNAALTNVRKWDPQAFRPTEGMRD